MRKPKSDYSIQTVDNALSVLEAFRDDECLGVTGLAHRLGLHKNNVFRLLATLEERGYVEQCPGNDQYRLGPRCLEAGRIYLRNQDVLARLRPVLAALCADLGETVHAAVLRDHRAVHLHGEQPAERWLVAALRVGAALPLHASAVGKVLLGCSEPAVLEDYDRRIVQRAPLPAYTPATCVDSQKLYDELRNVAGQGYAVDVEEFAPGLCCVAAPVWGAEGELVAALSVSAPSVRLDAGGLHGEIQERLTAAGVGLSHPEPV